MTDLINWLAEASATTEDGEHLVHSYYPQFIRMDGQMRSAQQASAYLAAGEWVSPQQHCPLAQCLRPDHLVSTVEDREEQDLALVAAASVPRLADLLRTAKGRGLLTARTEYH